MDGTAVVLGASVAGLLAARALADTYRDVLVVDRDDLPDEITSVPRRGVPHGQHTHGLLGGGLRAIEGLLPGATAELIAGGVPAGDACGHVRFCPNGVRFKQMEIGQQALAPSRPYLESYLRQRVRKLPGVRIMDSTDIVGLADDGRGRVTGAHVHTASGGAQVVDADLVVDATGRGSRMPIWLDAMGFTRPPEDKLRVDLVYTTRHYRLSRDDIKGDLALIIAPTVAHPRGGVLEILEGDRAIVTVFGFMGDGARGDEIVEYARTLPLPDLYDVLRDAQPLDEPVEFRFPASVRRRYERLDRFPEGLLVVGDAICSFNPLYGQGMSVAAMEAATLHRMVGAGGFDALKFFKAVAPIVDTPWQIVVGGDLAFPFVEGERTRMGRFINAYLGRMHVAAQTDATLAAAFIRVSNLLASPASLLRLDRAAKVLVKGRAPKG